MCVTRMGLWIEVEHSGLQWVNTYSFIIQIEYRYVHSTGGL